MSSPNPDSFPWRPEAAGVRRATAATAHVAERIAGETVALSRLHAARPSADRGRRAPLLQLDPELGALLDDTRREAARYELTAPVSVLDVGQWDVARFEDREHALDLGLLVVEGVLAREIELHGIVSTELLGPGDVARPWQSEVDGGLVSVAIGWNALTSVRVAILDGQLVARLAHWPEVNAALMERLHARAERLAITQAICQLKRVDQRLLALFRHLAGRFGRVCPDGVLVPLALSHRLIAQLIGARRPTVSTAFAQLAGRRELLRLQDGTWLLPRADAAIVVPSRLDVIAQRRRLIPAAQASPTFADQRAVP